MAILGRDMTDRQFRLALEFLGTVDVSTGLLLDGLNSEGGLDYSALECDAQHVGLETRDHTAVKEAFAHAL